MIAHSPDIKSFFFLIDKATDWQNQPLDDKGRQEAEEAGKILVGYEILSLCFSPLTRTKETAQIIAKHCHCGLYPIEGFKERHGQGLDSIEKEDDFIERVHTALLAMESYPSPILIVSHLSVLKIICSHLEVDDSQLISSKGIIHFFQRLGQWVAKPLEVANDT